ncbi:MAG: tyrosine recombinase [Phycisphaerales bacterium]|nr:tyrosine recombinase [Phycisphaerales bacterium]
MRPSETPSPVCPVGFTKPLRDFLAFIRIEAGLSRATIEAYGRDLRDLAADLDAHGIPEPASARAVDLAEHIQRLHREHGLKPASLTRHLATIRVFFRFLAANGRVPNDPTRVLERPARWRKLPNVLTPLQMKRLLSAPSPERTKYWLRDRAMLELMYAAGLRAAEVGTLRLDQYNRQLGMLVVIGKGNKHRIVPIGRPAQEWTEQYLGQLRPELTRFQDGRDDHRLLLSATGRPLDRVAVWQIVKRTAHAAGLGHVHPHMLRHSFATHLVVGGADLRVVQELLGHADIGTTQVYTHIDRQHLREIVKSHHPRG